MYDKCDYVVMDRTVSIAAIRRHYGVSARKMKIKLAMKKKDM
jgi:hypothetical protein